MVSCRRLEDQVQIRVDPRGRAGWHQGGGVHLLDDGRAGETIARAQPLARVDRRWDEIARLRQPYRAALHDGAGSVGPGWEAVLTKLEQVLAETSPAGAVTR